ncbi:hypothetical protein ACFUJR_27845 [Streptomyces sp. NPDC057271]|uniref:hypothetical protein n=1 Tax=unclassified Streptomyces TaxID=2593676 RepID=UPI0036390BCB
MDTDEQIRLANDALRAAINHNSDHALDCLEALGADGDPSPLFDACSIFAAAGTQALHILHGGHRPSHCGGFWAIQEAVPGSLAEHPHNAFAVRFVAAYANEDPDSAQALFLAALDAGQADFSNSVVTLLAYTAHLHRQVCPETH